MLFNKHSETKQRFGIRKLTIGATSVLLSTLFLTVNNGQKVHAATDETVTNADNKSGTEDKAVTTENSETEDKAQEATNVTKKTNEDKTATTEEKQTGAVAKTSEKVGDNATTDKSSETQASEDKVSSDDKTTDVANTELLRQLTIKKSLLLLTRLKKNNVTTPTSEVAKPAVNNKLAAPAPAPSTAGLSDDGLVATDDQGVTLSISKNTLGEGGQLGKSGITVKLSGAVNAGDIYTIKVPNLGWIYQDVTDSQLMTPGALGGFATAKKTTEVIDGYNYNDYQITFSQGVTIDNIKGFQIIINNGSNGRGVNGLADDIKDGKFYQKIYWSHSSQADPSKIVENSSLNFTRIVETGFNNPSLKLTSPDGSKITKLLPNTNYQFTLSVNQSMGVNGRDDSLSRQVHSARNLGSVITIPTPKGFVLDPVLSMQSSAIDGTKNKTTIKQIGGAGGDIVIKVPKGSGRQGYENAPGYVLVGKFDIERPTTTTTLTAKKDIKITEQVLTKDGTKYISATIDPWQVKILGSDEVPTEGKLTIQIWGNNNVGGRVEKTDNSGKTENVGYSGQFTQTFPTKIVNYFNFSNDTAIDFENNLHLNFDFDDGLAVTALGTPKLDDSSRYKTRSYMYYLTLADGSKVTGKVAAGQKITSSIAIKNADLVPDFWAAGAHGYSYVNYVINGNNGTKQKEMEDNFTAYGYISDKLNNENSLPNNTIVTSTFKVSSSIFNNNTFYSVIDNQRVLSKDTIKSDLKASGNQNSNNHYYSPSIDYTKGDYGTIGLTATDNSNKVSDRIVEPIFYYVLPQSTNFTGDINTIKSLNRGITDNSSKLQIKPKLTTYMVGKQQVVKLDYSGTGFVFDAGTQPNNAQTNVLPIAIDADAEPGSYTWNVYMYTDTGIVGTNPIENKDDIANRYTQNIVDQAKAAGGSGALYQIGQGNWVIATPPVAYAPNTVQGNLDVKAVANGKSDDKGSEEMSYSAQIANYSSGELKNPYMLVNFPQKDSSNTSFTFKLTGPEEFIPLGNKVTSDDFVTYYSTETQALPTTKDRGKTPDLTGYVTAAEVTDWSKVKSAIIKFNTSLPAGSIIGQIVFKGKDSNLKTDAGKTGYFRAAVMGETINPFLTENTSIKVVGKSTVNTRLHYQDTDRQDHYINVPTMTKEYNDNVDPMNSSDFDLNSIPKELIPDHYELVANQTPSIINNEDGNSKDATAEFNKTVTYAFDGDTVQFELVPKIDKATQTINRTVHFRTDGDNSKEVAEDVSTPVTVTELTNEVTGEKQYSAKITVNGQTQDLAVSVKDGKISIILPEVAIPNIKNYYVVDSTKDEANALTHPFTFTKDAKEVLENTVKYAPVKQELQIRVYDDEGEKPSEALDTKETGVTVYFTGNSETSFPSEVQTSLDKLKEYYERKNYEIKNLPSGSGQFDDTSNGDATTDSNPQYLVIRLEHGLKLEKENKTVTRTINYYDQDKKQLINDANPKVSELQTVTQTVNFERYAIHDQVANKIIGYATPQQVIFDDKNEAQLAQKDGYTHTTASDARAGYAVTSKNSNFASQTNYDLSKYGYEAPTDKPTDKDGKSFAQVDEVTPLPTDGDTIVKVYYREKVVTVTVDNPPVEGQTVPGTDAKFPANDWSAQKATNTSTRTIHYIYDEKTFVNGEDVSGQPVPSLKDIEQKVNFTQSAKINLVTGVVSYQGDWKATSSSTTNQKGETIPNKGGTSYAQVDSPSSKNGYPELKGYTPHSETVDAVEAIHGTDAGDVYVRYVANKSLVQIEYIDEDTRDVIKLDKPEGTSGEKLVYSTDSAIRDFEKQGYELVSDGFTDNDHNLNKETFDSYDDVPNGQYLENINQKWTVTLKHKKIIVTSEQPKSTTDKITDDHGYDHNYPAGVDQADLNNTVTRTISSKYSDKDGTPWGPVDQKVSYKRDATIDLVKLNKEDADAVTYTNWEPAEAGKESFDSMPVTHVEPGYVADYQIVPSADVTKDQDGKAQNGQNIVVTYSPVGVIIPVDKDGNEIPGAPTPKYNNDENDPTKVTTTHVPKIPGYHPEVPSVTPDEPGDNTKVVYTPEKQELQLKVYDQDLDKYLGGTDSFYGLTDQEVGEDPQTRLDELKKQFAEWGFDIVEVPELAKNYDNTENGTSDQDNKPQVFVLVVKHHIETVTPDDPKTPDDKIPNTNQNYPGGLTETDLSKTITRTIIVHMPDGSTKEIKQEVVYTRTATVDSVTKEVKYTDWTSKNSNWPEYQSPDVPGYTVDIEKVELAKVPVDGHDVTVEINYTADPVPDEPVNPRNPGNPGTTTPDQPQQPGKPTDPTKPSEPNKPSNPGRPTNPNHPTKPTKPVTPAKPDQTHDQHSKVNGETDLNGFVDGISDEKAGAVAGASDNAQAGAKKLPQTSGESGWQASLLGMGLFFISLFGFKKKKEDE